MVESAHATLRARHFEGNELKIVKLSCNFLFWCLKQMENVTFWGCKYFFPKIWVWNIKIIKILLKIYWNSIFSETIINKCIFFVPNLNLECFQLSFDMHIAHIDEKFWFRKTTVPKMKNFLMKPGYYSIVLCKTICYKGWFSKLPWLGKDANFHLRPWKYILNHQNQFRSLCTNRGQNLPMI